MAAMEQVQIIMPPVTKLFTRGVIVLLILTAAGFMFSMLAPGFVNNYTALNPHAVLGGQVWQLLTYPFTETLPINLVFNCLVVLFLGSAIEREWRTRSFLILWMMVSIGCGLIWIVVNLITGNNLPAYGASGCVYGIIGAMGILNRGRRFYMFIAVLEGQHIALLMITIGLIFSLFRPLNLIWISGALIAFIYIKILWKIKAVKINSGINKRKPGNFVDID